MSEWGGPGPLPREFEDMSNGITRLLNKAERQGETGTGAKTLAVLMSRKGATPFVVAWRLVEVAGLRFWRLGGFWSVNGEPLPAQVISDFYAGTP